MKKKIHKGGASQPTKREETPERFGVVEGKGNSGKKTDGTLKNRWRGKNCKTERTQMGRKGGDLSREKI